MITQATFEGISGDQDAALPSLPARRMPAISLWQPWASALFAPTPGSSAIKLHETRHWQMPKSYVNQVVAIHAAKRDTSDESEFWTDVVLASEAYLEAFGAIGILGYKDLPRGCVIGTVRFGPSIPTTGQTNVPLPDRDWGNFSEERWAWPVLEHHRFTMPIPCQGRQGFFTAEIPAP